MSAALAHRILVRSGLLVHQLRKNEPWTGFCTGLLTGKNLSLLEEPLSEMWVEQDLLVRLS